MADPRNLDQEASLGERPQRPAKRPQPSPTGPLVPAPPETPDDSHDLKPQRYEQRVK